MALRSSGVIKSAVRNLAQSQSQTEVALTVRHFSCTNRNDIPYKLVVVGGGAGGCSTAAKFCQKLEKGQVAVIEPSRTHAYQPMWTLVGAGIKKMEQSIRPMSEVLPPACEWIQDSAVKFDPDNNTVTTATGQTVEYEYLVMASGLQLNYDKIKGLKEALETDPQVCSNYHPEYVKKTYPALQATHDGNAIFTFPNTPIKCAGAPQKIMYLAEEIFTQRGERNQINVLFNTSLPVIFGVKKYAESLLDVIKKRHITVNFRHNLVEVRADKREAVFQLLDSEKGETKTFEYSFLHAVPPMSVPDVVRNSPLVNADGWVDVSKETLQHNKYPNVFAIGDCTSLPTSKTAAAAAAQCGIVFDNLTAVMNGQEPTKTYDGYTSCPLITGKNKCILAEFDYDAEPLETFPIDQGKERWSMYQMKAQAMPLIYWHAMMKGLWRGPELIRKALHFGSGR